MDFKDPKSFKSSDLFIFLYLTQAAILLLIMLFIPISRDTPPSNLFDFGALGLSIGLLAVGLKLWPESLKNPPPGKPIAPLSLVALSLIELPSLLAIVLHLLGSGPYIKMLLPLFSIASLGWLLISRFRPTP